MFNMAQLFILSILISCVSLLQVPVLSQPVSSGISASTGTGIAGTLTGGAAGGNMDVDAAAGTATEAASELTADASGIANDVVEGVKDVGEAIGQLGTVPLSAGAGMFQLGTGKFAAGTNAALGAGRFGTQLGNSFLGGAANGFGLGGSTVPSIEAIQRQTGALSPFQWQVIDRALRDGALGVVDLADQSTGQLNAYGRPVLTSGAGVIDNGLAMMGYRQPVATPIAEATWQTFENGRQNGMDLGRSFINREYQLPYLINPSSYLNGGAGSGIATSGGAGGSGLFGFELPTGSVATEVGTTV